MNLKNNKIKNVVIVYRHDTKKAKLLAIEAAAWLKAKKVNAFSHPKQSLGKGVQKWPEKKSFKDVGLVLVLGGDGTYLEAVRLLSGLNTPILGVNLGSLGFLTETREESLYSTLELTLNNKMETRLRSMLKLSVKRANKLKLEMTALNDIVIERGAYSHLMNLSIYSGKHLVSPMKADGIIISSPTGSTAYNLAAGGPILHPYVKAFVLTPICPHSLTNRPLIFPDDQELRVKLNSETQKGLLTVDGQLKMELTSKDEVFISRATCDHVVLRRPGHNYFELLREKLKFGERA